MCAFMYGNVLAATIDTTPLANATIDVSCDALLFHSVFMFCNVDNEIFAMFRMRRLGGLEQVDQQRWQTQAKRLGGLEQVDQQRW